MMDIILKFIIEQFWPIMALTGSPLCGYAAGQRYKRYLKATGEVKSVIRDMKIMNMAGLITTGFSMACWLQTHDSLVQSLLVGAMVGMAQLLIVRVLLAIITKRLPKVAEEIKEDDEATTITECVDAEDITEDKN